MGWLRDLMLATDPPVKSFGKLAVAARSTTEWPASVQLQSRSLATLFSRLDRGLDLAWLDERPGCQLALARVLGVSPDEIRGAFAQPERQTPRALKLRALPTARPVDLALEPLPPGIPKLLLGSLEEGVFWVAPPGSGRSLLGRWLEARGQAVFLEASDWDSVQEVAAEHAPDRPLFVELTDPTSKRLPKPRPGLCIAAAFEPPEDAGFRVVRSPELSEVLRPLLSWTAERLPKGSRFDPETAEVVFREKLQAGQLDSLGSVLGAIGLVDEFGLREFATRAEERLLRRYIETRVARSLDASLPYASWIRRSIYGAFLAMVERALVDSDVALEEPRSFDAWLRLVPPELERHVDLEWMRLSLAQIDTGVRASDVERAARRLPPGAFRIVTTLEQAQLLQRNSDGRLKIDSLWLTSAIRRSAIEALLGRSAFEWGEALLRPGIAPRVAEALLTRTLADGGSILASVLDLEAEDQPAYAAAVDVALRIAGVTRLLGNDLGIELIEGLVSETEALVIDFGTGLLEPRIDLAPVRDGAYRYPRGHALLSPGTFYLALLSATEVLEHGAAPRLHALIPWHRTAPSAELKRAYDAIVESLSSQPPWQRAAFSMIARVRRLIGNVDGADTPHALELPAQGVEEIEHGVLAFSTIQQAGTDSTWLEAFLAIANEREIEAGDVARAIWVAWDREQRPEGAGFLAPNAPAHALFWSNVPGELLSALLSDARRHHVPYEVFSEEQWLAFLVALERVPDLVRESRAFGLMPPHFVAQTLELELEWSQAPESIATLWQRFPELLSGAVLRELAKGVHAQPDALSTLLSAAPEPVTSELLSELEKRQLGLSPSALVAVRALLRRMITARGPDWRPAYRKLSELERELRRTQGSALRQ